MPTIKKLKVSFDVDVDVLLKALAQSNCGFTVDAYQTAAVLGDEHPLMLEDQSRFTLRDLVLTRLKHTGKPVKLDDLKVIATNNGFPPKSLQNLMYVLFTQKLVSRPAYGTYKITKRGMGY